MNSPKHLDTTPTPNPLAPYAKCIAGAVASGLTSLITTAPDGWTTTELLTALAVAFTTLAGVYAAPKNRDTV